MKEPSITCYHICNSKAPEPAGCKNIYSQEELLEVGEEDNAIYLLNIHLNWNGRSLSSDYGFEVANYLRTYKRSLLPIIFYSWIQREYFEYKSKKSLKYNLLFGRGAAFLESPFNRTEITNTIKNVPPLSQSALHDVVTMLADVKGIVLDRLNHNLKFGCDPRQYFDEVEPYLTERQKILVGFEEYRQKLISLTKDDNEPAFHDTKEAFLSICNTILTERGKDVSEPPSQKYKILIVEDVEIELKDVTNYLEKNFTVVSINDGEEAIKILSRDLSNEILAVISDWRLYTDGSRSYWQKYQGYEVLEAASKTGSRALFALTSQADFVVHHIRNALGFKFTLLKKQNLKSPDKSPEQWLLFSDLLHSGCADALSIISEMPGSKNWYKSVNGVSYKELYLQKKQSLEATAFFASVTNKADEIWDYLKKESRNNFKDIGLLKDLYGLEIPKKNLNLFPVLVLRMIWLGLWYELYGESIEKDRDEINHRLMRVYRIVCTGSWRGEILDNRANVELNKLCLTINDIQQRKILPDERAWLSKNGLVE
jgi:CheY-like chemotaxis protein